MNMPKQKQKKEEKKGMAVILQQLSLSLSHGPLECNFLQK